MVRSALSAVLGLAATAAAVNQPPPVPQDAQIGLLDFPVTCNLLNFLKNTFDVSFSATAPVFGPSGGEIYYTDVVGLINIPSYITSLAPLVNAHQAQANVTVYLNLENASPSTLLVYQATIDGIQFASGTTAQIRIPQGNGTLPPLGPVTLGQSGVAHRILLGDVTVDIELQDSTGKSVLFDIPVSCGQQNIDYILGSVNVDSSAVGAPQSPSNGFVPQFPPTQNNQESGAFRFPYDCTFGALGEYTVDLEIEGTVPTYFAPGSEFSLTNAAAFLRVPTNLTTLAAKGFPSATDFYTTISSFEILYTNANPASFQVASTPITSTSQIPPAGEQLIIAIPENGDLTIGPVTAGANGEVVGIAVGPAVATVVLQDSTGKSLFTLDVTCKVPAPLELIGIPITSVTPDNYSLGQTVTGSATATAPATAVPTTAAASPTSSAGGFGFSFPSFSLPSFNFGGSGSATTTAAAAGASATGSICFDDGDCLLSGGGSCVKPSTGFSLTGNCS